mmetsp:Transcript_9852/g.15153  ORF Transcript_9852/g.15153 Transcript_9852/m.15153 type:complete len:381 (+) Transcript_9852:152-1294(+)|eukprot:CAMPEP_0195298628 /NCGR_PEP_ID=MMETSP0707-20130614/23911_1 /TAXON_ID=33640 /ORGANISM="Asterionellopsis glacialis, Strain CCMP134" /LENGTH=380 /DNA_ID=CAMNT_0040360809 /DNA_START=85 /DNA_END=1227 /DNA_ORIENTATION=+
MPVKSVKSSEVVISPFKYGEDACRYANGCLEQITNHSELKEGEEIPLVDRSEIRLGELLGTGGFSDVFELIRVELRRNDPDTNQHDLRLQLSKRAIHERFAIKFLREEVTHDSEKFSVAAADLLIEARFLRILTHKHIIGLHGVCAAGAIGFAKYGIDGFFLILDRLYDTLDKRLEYWKELRKGGDDQVEKNNVGNLRKAIFIQRLRVAKDLSAALRHLHKFNVIFRDLKPENVGFDMTGTVKLFDFGLARELDPREKNSDDTYNMTGQTGSRMYMSPEVVKGEPYNLTADVYSFGLIMWQLCALDDPYIYMDVQDHLDYVVNWNFRPKLNESWPDKLCSTMEKCWSSDHTTRPRMKEVYTVLTEEVRKLRKQGGGAEAL